MRRWRELDDLAQPRRGRGREPRQRVPPEVGDIEPARRHAALAVAERAGLAERFEQRGLDEQRLVGQRAQCRRQLRVDAEGHARLVGSSFMYSIMLYTSRKSTWRANLAISEYETIFVGYAIRRVLPRRLCTRCFATRRGQSRFLDGERLKRRARRLLASFS